jgi:hypothetical protein
VLAPATHETGIAAPALPAHQPLGPVRHLASAPQRSAISAGLGSTWWRQ